MLLPALEIRNYVSHLHGDHRYYFTGANSQEYYKIVNHDRLSFYDVLEVVSVDKREVHRVDEEFLSHESCTTDGRVPPFPDAVIQDFYILLFNEIFHTKRLLG